MNPIQNRLIQNRPIVGITMGDPAGIGPEILIKALNRPEVLELCRPLVLGDAHLLKKALKFLPRPFKFISVAAPSPQRDPLGAIPLINLSHLPDPVIHLPAPTRETGTAMIAYIRTGVALAMNQEIDALVTCPITKTGLKMAGSPFHGHTELIADQTNTRKFAMMLTGKRLKVVLVTIHMPLGQVAQSLTTENIYQTICLTQESLVSRFGIPCPKLAVAGLNPHAGEDSMFGKEEKEIIAPAVLRAQAQGILVDGPLPPDTVFFHGLKGKYHAIVSMYHDQGLIPFKLVHFKDGVNTTLGLPIIRTSVDHGTAYDIAWKGMADPSSLVEAIYMAAVQAKNQIKIQTGA